jgi:large subunit ribosomal protein L15
MDISEAKKTDKPRKQRIRAGRGTGSRRGKLAGRGMNGAKSRSGWSSRGINGGAVPLWRRMPKRGFSNQPHRKDYSVVNVGQLERFDADTEVTPERLKEAGLVKQVAKGGIKVLGGGELSKSLSVRADAFSRSAVEKIEAAGGSTEVIPGPKPPERNKMGAGRAEEAGVRAELEQLLEGE